LYDYFQRLIGCAERRQTTFEWDDLHMPRIMSQHQIDEPFSEEDIQKAVSELLGEKEPDPDGFTGVFYRVCWDIVKQEIVAAFHCFYKLSASPLPKLNVALLTLILKKEVLEQSEDYMPISLIHSFTQLVSKALEIHLSKHIDELISNAQSAFIRRRCIQENFLYVQNLARTYHRKKIPSLLLKLDISKAFDSISWEYLLKLLLHRGFPSRWRNWISLLLSTSSSSISLNGTRGPWIRHKRGLQQGDPLSSYLFILAIDTLQYVFRWAT
jgi:hypothetical protein